MNITHHQLESIPDTKVTWTRTIRITGEASHIARLRERSYIRPEDGDKHLSPYCTATCLSEEISHGR